MSADRIMRLEQEVKQLRAALKYVHERLVQHELGTVGMAKGAPDGYKEILE